MANEVRYENLNWPVGSPVAGERLATNGYYTGHHKGSVMQDNAVEGTEQPYEVEENIVRYGTMTGDYLDEHFPSLSVSLTQTLTKCTSSVSANHVAKSAEVSVTYTASDGYELPSTITVKIGGATATVSTDYTWNDSTGVLTIPANKVTGNLEVAVTATAASQASPGGNG